MTTVMKTKPFGTWSSPVTADLIVSDTVGLDQIMLDGEDIYWLEARPAEGGRNVVVRRGRDGRNCEINPVPYNVRTLVHEMGGGAYTVADGEVYFCNYQDQQLYRRGADQAPRPLTAGDGMRFADGVVDRRRGRLIAVREDHAQGGGEPVNTLVSLKLDGSGESLTLASGSDFYAAPRLSPDGGRLAWLSWRHPNMPWDGTELWLGRLDDAGAVVDAERIAGGASESVFQPEWSPDGVLHFVSDRSGWWNLYRRQGGEVHALAPRKAEFGLPQWIFGMSTYGFAAADRIVCCFGERGNWCLAELDLATGELTPIDTPYTEISSLRVGTDQVVFVGAAATRAPAVVRLNLATRRCEVLRRGGETEVDPGYLSLPEPVEFCTERGLTAHGFFYRPCNRDHVAPAGEKPPLRVLSHGGPTSATSGSLNLAIQFWTSRGFAVLDVNYGGSTGYGRAYRERLNGNWGIVDVDDCVNGARYLIARGEVDPGRLAIKGGSAGGFTTLSALTFRDMFKAGASYYGIGDLEALARDTHKFESHYMDRLIGPYPLRRDRYLARSPIRFVDRLSCPIIFLQGLEDKIVPPNQSEAMVQALRDKGVPVAYVAFPGEQHGFRRAENIKRALEAELYFYGRIFGFQPADVLEPVAIDKLSLGSSGS